MLATANKEASVEYTTVLPVTCLDELRNLAERNVIPSISQGIRLAIKNFVIMQKQQEYALSMQEAAKDNEFINRTMDAHNDFR